MYDLPKARALLEKAKPFIVSVTAVKASQMMENGAVYTLMNGAVSVLNEGYYDSETGVREGNDLCGTLIL